MWGKKSDLKGPNNVIEETLGRDYKKKCQLRREESEEYEREWKQRKSIVTHPRT